MTETFQFEAEPTTTGPLTIEDSFDFTAESVWYYMDLKATVAVKWHWLYKFLLWLLPKVGIDARLAYMEYRGATFSGQTSGCALRVGVHWEECQSLGDAEYRRCGDGVLCKECRKR